MAGNCAAAGSKCIGDWAAAAQCTNDCGLAWDGLARDGNCDDGGPGSEYSYCDFGTDCADCGPRGDALTPGTIVALVISGGVGSFVLASSFSLAEPLRHGRTPTL